VSRKFPLTDEEQITAKDGFRLWFKNHPGKANPTDINSLEKFVWLRSISFEELQLMQRARKCNTKKFGYPFPWTHWEYWRRRQTPPVKS
jgi:hypothetical protein